MPLATVRRLLNRRSSLTWLLALVLWLPVAQWAAAAHGLLHLPSAASEEGDRAAHPPGSCNTCVVAAAMVGAAPAAEFRAPAPPQLAQSRTTALPASASAPAPRAPYHSRAPPLLHA